MDDIGNQIRRQLEERRRQEEQARHQADQERQNVLKRAKEDARTEAQRLIQVQQYLATRLQELQVESMLKQFQREVWKGRGRITHSAGIRKSLPPFEPDCPIAYVALIFEYPDREFAGRKVEIGTWRGANTPYFEGTRFNLGGWRLVNTHFWLVLGATETREQTYAWYLCTGRDSLRTPSYEGTTYDPINSFLDFHLYNASRSARSGGIASSQAREEISQTLIAFGVSAIEHHQSLGEHPQWYDSEPCPLPPCLEKLGRLPVSKRSFR